MKRPLLHWRASDMTDHPEPLTEAELRAIQERCGLEKVLSWQDDNRGRLLIVLRGADFGPERLHPPTDCDVVLGWHIDKHKAYIDYAHAITMLEAITLALSDHARLLAEVRRLGKLERTLWAENVKLKALLERLRQPLYTKAMFDAHNAAIIENESLKAENERLRLEINRLNGNATEQENRIGRMAITLAELRAENAKLAAGWASVDTTKLADITDLDECKRRLQRERERSHGAIRDLCDLANTPAGAYKDRLDAANAELAKLRAVADAAKAFRLTHSKNSRDALDQALAALKGGGDADGK